VKSTLSFAVVWAALSCGMCCAQAAPDCLLMNPNPPVS
jgi:hypothetical protein